MENEDRKPIRTMMTFENKTFEYTDLKSWETSEKYNPEQPESLDFNLLLRFSSWPFEVNFPYSSESLRESKIEELKTILKRKRFVFL